MGWGAALLTSSKLRGSGELMQALEHVNVFVRQRTKMAADWRASQEGMELMQRATRTWSSGAIVPNEDEVATVPRPQQGKEQEVKCH